MKTHPPLLVAAFAAILAAACSPGAPKPPRAAESPFAKYLWFDAEANFARFASQDSIRYWLDRTVEAGFNRIVVDVKPVEGDVLYKSGFMPELTDFRGTRVDRRWDYLQCFLDEAAARNLRVTVSTTIFPVGLVASRQGPAYRDPAFDGRTCTVYRPEGLSDIRDDRSAEIAFLNPAMPENQEWALRFVRELLTRYRFDAYALDYCRYPGAGADFSEFSRRDFEAFLGHAVERFPEDIFTYDKDGNRVPGKYYKPWWEYRAKVIRSFIARVREEIDRLQPGVELEYWAASWLHAIYANGQNWASPRSEFWREYLDSWASPEYGEAGFADLLDVFITGTYLERVRGADDPESVEFGLNRSLRDVQGDCTVYGSLYAKNHLDEFEDAVYLCLQKTKGVMVFDIVQVIKNGLWDDIRRGIDRAEREAASGSNEQIGYNIKTTTP